MQIDFDEMERHLEGRSDDTPVSMRTDMLRSLLAAARAEARLREELGDCYETILMEHSYTDDGPCRGGDDIYRWQTHSFMSDQEEAIAKLVELGLWEWNEDRSRFRKIRSALASANKEAGDE